MGRGRYLISLALACLIVHSSFCLVQESIPEGGSTLAGDEGEENITIICTLLREAGGPQQVTEWFIQRPGQSSPQLILDNPDFANFEIVGEPIPNTTNRDFRTNFTILRLTSDLDRAVISCGLGGINIVLAANFTLRIYQPPILQDKPTMTVVEGGGEITIDLDLDPEAFPFPQFQWTVNGQVAMNNTPRVIYSYPGVTFTSYDRVDSGTYNLTATNYRLDNTSVIVGMDMGSFSLDVQFPAQIEGSGDTQHVILEGGDITLVCGTRVIGNPTPTISWTDNNGTTVSDGSGISGSDTLMLTIIDITRNHTGNWTCSVENSVRDEERQIMLVVVVPPSPPTDVTIQSMDIGPTYARVCWQAPLLAGVPEVSRYEVTATPVSGGTSVTARTTDNSRDVNVTGLAPGTNYEFRVVAISEFGGVVGSSSLSDPGFANTTFTVPAPVCQGPPTSSSGVITVRWDYAHTGGLDLTQVVIAATRGVETTQLDVPYGNLTDLSQMTLDVTTFTAGFQYTFTVTAYNELGPGTAVCDPVTHLIGIPRTPEMPIVESNTPGSVVLTLSTRESGTTPRQMFSFVVNITFDGSRFSRILEANDYMDNEQREFTIDGLMAGEFYLFSAQAQNQFGSSDFANSDQIRVAGTATPPTAMSSEPPPLRQQDNSAAIAGGVVGGIVAVVLICLIVLLIVYLVLRHREGGESYNVEGGKRSVKVEEVGDIDIGVELQGNANTNNTEEKAPPRELHYADLESFQKAPDKSADSLPKATEEPVEYATIQTVQSPKRAAETAEAEGEGTEEGDKSQTSTTLV